jgi:hypothetical protein
VGRIKRGGGEAGEPVRSGKPFSFLVGIVLGIRAAAGPHGCPMPSHKFQVGETVYVRRAISRNVPSGAYVVTKRLPYNGREFEYRIKSASEAHERVVRESELAKA